MLPAHTQLPPPAPPPPPPPTPHLPQDYELCVSTTDLGGQVNPGGDGLLSYCHWRNNLTITYPDTNPLKPAHEGGFGGRLSIHELGSAAAGLLPEHNAAEKDPRMHVDPDVREELRYAVTTHVWRRKFTLRRMPDFYELSVKYLVDAYNMALVAAELE